MIHYLEGTLPSIINEKTGVPLKQEEMLVKIYSRPNSDEVKTPSIIRYLLNSFIIMLVLLLFLRRLFFI